MQHGFSLGQLCQPTGKWNVYEHHIRVPGMIRGPGIVPGRVLKVPTGNVDYGASCRLPLDTVLCVCVACVACVARVARTLHL